MKPCTQCGAVCPDDAICCPTCGASFLAADSQEAAQAAAPQTPVPSSSSPVPPSPSQPASPQSPLQPPYPQSPVQPSYPQTPPQQPYVQAPGQPSYPHTPGQSPYPQAPGRSPYPYNPTQEPYSRMPGQPPYPQTPGQPPYPQAPYFQKRTAPLVLGIIGIIFALFIPLVTYACSIPGLVMANQDIRRGLPNQNARILNIVALSVAVFVHFLSILFNLLILS